MTIIYSDLLKKRFAAYNELDLDKFFATYSENALLEVYDRESGKLKVFRGLAEIKVYFKHHLKCLKNADGSKGSFSSPYFTIKPGGIQNNGNSSFFPWEAKSDTTEFKDCAETFVFEPVDDGNSALISHHYQFIREIPLTTTIYNDLWNKHFTAHNANDLDGVVATYSKNALLQVYDRESRTLKVYRGHDEIKKYFELHLKCLTTITDGGDLKIAKVISPFEDKTIKHDGVRPDGNTLYVPWGAKSDSTEFKDCADTFVFEPVDEGKSALISHHYQFIREISLNK